MGRSLFGPQSITGQCNYSLATMPNWLYSLVLFLGTWLHLLWANLPFAECRLRALRSFPVEMGILKMVKGRKMKGGERGVRQRRSRWSTQVTAGPSVSSWLLLSILCVKKCEHAIGCCTATSALFAELLWMSTLLNSTVHVCFKWCHLIQRRKLEKSSFVVCLCSQILALREPPSHISSYRNPTVDSPVGKIW